MTKDDHTPDLPGSLSDTIARSDLEPLLTDLLKYSSETLSEEARKIPVVGALIGMAKIGLAVRDAVLLRKLTIFLKNVADIPIAERERTMNSLQNDDRIDDIGERLLFLIDRLETPTKASLLGQAFGLLMRQTISNEEFWRIAVVIDRLLLRDIQALKGWRETDLNRVEHVRKHLYLSVGLGWFVTDASSRGFEWQHRLCEIFSDYLIVGLP